MIGKRNEDGRKRRVRDEDREREGRGGLEMREEWEIEEKRRRWNRREE